MKHFLVIGRIPHDDEDSAYKYTGQLTLDEVIQLFRDEISEDRGVEADPEDPDTRKESHHDQTQQILQHEAGRFQPLPQRVNKEPICPCLKLKMRCSFKS